MAKGKKTGGRQKGSLNKANQAVVAAMKEAARDMGPGMEPRDYLLEIMRDTENDKMLRMEAAKALMPFVHCRQGVLPVPVQPDQKTIEADCVELVKFHRFKFLAPKQLTNDDDD